MIDRKKALEGLLERLRESNTENDSDIDLILRYLEDFLDNPSTVKGGSKKFMEFEIAKDMNSMSKIYKMTWRKFDSERFAYDK